MSMKGYLIKASWKRGELNGEWGIPWREFTEAATEIDEVIQEIREPLEQRTTG